MKIKSVMNANNRLAASLSSDFLDYNISLSDVDSSKFRIEIVPQNQSSTITINENTYNIYHASININNLDLEAILSMTVDENIDLETSFFNTNGNPEELSCYTYDSNIQMPVINLIEPLIKYLLFF